MGKKPLSSKELLETFDRVSEKIIFWGCGNPMEDTERCIESRIKEALEYRTEQYNRTKSREAKQTMDKLKNLIKYKFPYQWAIEAWIHPHPIYKEKLGISDEEYKERLQKKEESANDLSMILEYERHLKSKRLKKKKKAK